MAAIKAAGGSHGPTTAKTSTSCTYGIMQKSFCDLCGERVWEYNDGVSNDGVSRIVQNKSHQQNMPETVFNASDVIGVCKAKTTPNNP